MSKFQNCSNCGGTDIECDPSRGDTVCTNCGTVLEDYCITSEVQFEENSRGGCNVVGQFVSAESRGAANGFGGYGSRLDSRQITLKKAKSGIELLCNQLKLTSSHANSSLSYYKMALDKNLTRGRRNVLVQAACVYLNCRVLGLPHLLIDISDILKICCYELGKAFLYISQGLCLDGGLPLVDPCLYIMRYATKLEFGNKINEVVHTATRLVERMKKDSIHCGRRPSGLCGAALLMAARFHDFNRTTEDIVKVVRVHESTLRKRLTEFSETPTSSLTLEAFMNANLEEGDEQDPPSFKAARRKEEFEKLQALLNSGEETLMTLQEEIESQLELSTRKRKRITKRKVVDDEVRDQSDFIDASTCETIQEILEKDNLDSCSGCLNKNIDFELGPNIQSMGLACSLNDEDSTPLNTIITDYDTNLDDIDDDELDAYIMDQDEAEEKKSLWLELNADYLEEQKLKEEKLKQKMESKKPEKKRRKYTSRKKQSAGSAVSAADGIAKMLQGKTFSSKRINYEILGKLQMSAVPISDADLQQLKPPVITRTTISRATVSLQTKSRYGLRPNILNNIKVKAPNLPSQTQSVPVVEEINKNTMVEENDFNKMDKIELLEANNKIEEEYENIEDYYEDDEEYNNDDYNDEEEFGIEEY